MNYEKLLRDRRVWLAGAVVLILLVTFLLVNNNGTQGWTADQGTSAHPLAMLVDPVRANTIYIGTEDGNVLRSTDGGQSWTKQKQGLPPKIAVSALQMLPDGTQLLAGTSAGLFVSDDQGTTFKDMGGGTLDGKLIDAIALGSADNQTLYVGLAPGGIFASQDGGKSWAAASLGLPDNAYIYGFSVAPHYDALYAAVLTTGVFASKDGGQSWQSSSKGLPAGVDAFALTRQSDSKGIITHLYTGTSAGFFSSDDQGVTWQANNNGLPHTRVIDLAIDTTSSLLVAGTDDGVFGTQDGGKHWSTVGTGFPKGQHVGRVALIVPQHIVFAATDRLYLLSAAGNTGLASFERLLIFAILLGTILWVFARQRRILNEMTPKVPPPGSRPTPPAKRTTTET